jgi:hypothetical protein
MALGEVAGEMTEDRAAQEVPPDGGPEGEPDAGPGPGMPFEGFLNPMERRLALRIVEGLEPSDPQEEIHAWHLAATHLLAAERIGKARQPGLPERPQQIELGLAVRLMTLSDRKSAALDRHREMKYRREREEKRAAEKAAADAAAAGAARGEAQETRRAELADAPFLVVPEPVSPREWSRRVRPQQRRLGSGEEEPEGYREARERLWQERMVYVAREALARGQTEGTLQAPYPTDEEVAARHRLARRSAQGARRRALWRRAGPRGAG